MTILLQPAEVTPGSPVGGKAQALAELTQADLPVPPWFVVLPAAFELSIDEQQKSSLAKAESAGEVASTLTKLCPPERAVHSIQEAYDRLCPDGDNVAVRSSAADEDSATLSFAGQLESFLDVDRKHLLARVADVWRSGFSERIITYRRNAGLDPLPTPPAVVIQRLIAGEVSGVAFSADPVSGRHSVGVVAAVRGLGEALVSGEKDADTWHVDRQGRILERQIVERAVLTDVQVARIAELARAAELHFGRPQDIEWTVADDTVYLLQSRPITTLAAKPDPDGAIRVWDNSNIIESYSGVTTPLTFSFIKRCYAQVYRNFCRLMHVGDRIIEDNSGLFSNMLGLINGRVYYNVANWYRLLALLPGYKLNRRFTEEMLGLGGTLPAELEASLQEVALHAKIGDLMRLMRTAWGLVWNLLTIERRIARFYKRLQTVIPARPIDLSEHSPDELVELYRDLERQLLDRWDAPTINDFFAAAFHGSLRRLTGRWLPQANASLHNDLLCGDPNLVSMEIAGTVRAMAKIASTDPELVEILCHGTRTDIERRINGIEQMREHYARYLDRFGDRCLDELKLESASIRDDPEPLLRAIGGYAKHIARGENVTSHIEQQILEAAEATVRSALSGHPIRSSTYRWVLHQTRCRVRSRENLRYERTRAFGLARRIVVELGRRLSVLELLGEPRDIFYLTIEEILGFVEGTATTTDLRGLVGVRRAEYEGYREKPLPMDRFVTYGIPFVGEQFAPASTQTRATGESMHGIGCCPGVVRGPVSLVEDPRKDDITPGAIVVARRTDPGWVMIFPAATGLLVERGSMLSHSAIVAREMGLPTIVSVPGLTNWISDGDYVEMDGASGVITKVSPRECGS